MADPFFAETQYNDYVGTAAFDTHDGGDLHKLFDKYCSGKNGYFPVGLELGSLAPDEAGNIIIWVAAVKCADYGQTMDEIIRNTKGVQTVTLYRFDATIPAAHWAAFFKRTDIKAISKSL